MSLTSAYGFTVPWSSEPTPETSENVSDTGALVASSEELDNVSKVEEEAVDADVEVETEVAWPNSRVSAFASEIETHASSAAKAAARKKFTATMYAVLYVNSPEIEN
ncbi:uncharacterized protein IUM83_11351 [Phytophthora cinnamomi]|uniref:uncharacterized protein n=1 Tax=Phytophthora cinnamomi TaxID=4785 RepID=UPI003559FFB1|nr:hypothetical protein IUM83_11351 [Phytophthora cinnamomi]